MAKTTARKYQQSVLHHITRVLNYNDADLAAAYVGTLPAGAVITGSEALVTAAFNSTGPNSVTMGSLATGTEVMTSAQTAVASTGYKSSVSPTAAPYLVDLAADTDIYAIGVASAATAGRVILTVKYIAHTGPGGVGTP